VGVLPGFKVFGSVCCANTLMEKKRLTHSVKENNFIFKIWVIYLAQKFERVAKVTLSLFIHA
jgi:hypothetical protein